MADNSNTDFASLDAFLKDDSDRKIKNSLNAEFWKYIGSIVRKKAMGGKVEHLSFSVEERLKIDLGLLHPDLIDANRIDIEKLKLLGGEGPRKDGSYSFSQWLDVQFEKIFKKPEKEKLKFAVNRCDITLSNLEHSVNNLGIEREKIFETAFMAMLQENKQYTSDAYKRGVALIKNYKYLDKDYKVIETTKRMVENGKFMASNEKRGFIENQN